MARLRAGTVMLGMLLSAVVGGGCATLVADRGGLGRVPPPGEARAIVDVIHRLFDAMAEKDRDGMRAVFTDDARLLAPAPEGSVETFRTVDVEQFVQSVASAPDRVLERMWDPEVFRDGDIATVWAPYDVHLGGDFVHCGIDAFSLVRDGARWRIAFIAYTAYPDPGRCPEHPDGPPL